MSTATLFDDYKDAFIILLDHRQRAACCLQQSGQLSFDKAALLFRIANMAEWWAHVQRAAQGTLVQHVVAAQMHFGSFAPGAQLLQVTIAEFVFLVPLVTNRLSVGDALWHRRRRGRRGWIGFCDVS